MTPYVLNEDESDLAAKPKSIMVCSPNGELNGEALKPNGTVIAETPDSIPSRSSVSGKSIIGNGRNGKSGALKRVSFGSSKGSMVETLVYDHQEDLAPDQPLPPFATPPLLNGEESRLHPAKVRVKFIQSQPLAQVLACPSTPSPDVTLDLSLSDAMTSPVSDSYARQISAESGVDNPFRPDGELSREADTIVSLIKEGKPITSLKGDDSLVDGSLVANGHASDANTDSALASPVKEAAIAPTDASGAKTEAKSGANGNAPKDSYSNSSAAKPGVIEVRHGVISPPAETPQVEQVTIKKKSKTNCCILQ